MPFDTTDAFVEIQDIKTQLQYIINVLIENKLIKADDKEKTTKGNKATKQ